MVLSIRQQEFIADFASLWEQVGANAAQGRVLGLLYITDQPELAATDICEALGVSRGSVSQITRQLVRMRLIQRVSKPGERRDYYRVSANAWAESARAERALIGTMLNLFQRGLTLHNTSPPERRRAFSNTIAFLEDYDAALGAFLDSWKPRTGTSDDPETS